MRGTTAGFFFMLAFLGGMSLDAFAATKMFEISLLEPVSHNQTYEQVMRFARQKASRQALESAGMYVSSQSVVEQGRLTADEITAITAGIVKIETLEAKQVLESGLLHAFIKVQIELDPDELQPQIEKILRNKELMLQLKSEQDRVKTLEGNLQALIDQDRSARSQATSERERLQRSLEDALTELEALRQRQNPSILDRMTSRVDEGEIDLEDPVPGISNHLPEPQPVK